MIRGNFNELGLPDEVAEWADRNSGLVLKMRDSLAATYDSVPTKEQIWEGIASACAPEWRQARATCEAAQQRLEVLNLPENRPLGAIGWATGGDEIEEAQDAYNLSLSDFTMIDEGLRRREDLGLLFKILTVQMRMLAKSGDTSVAVRRAGLDRV